MKKRINLLCDECFSRNYTIFKEIGTQRFELKKHCSKCNKHTLHKETK